MADLVYGLTEQGLSIPPLSVVRDGINTNVRAKYGASFDVSDFSIAGQIIGIFAEAIYLVYELAEAVNSSQDPNKATGAALDAVCALTGTKRPPATYSTVVITCAGTGGTIVPTGTLIATGSTQAQFSVDSDVTLSSLSAWAGSTTYVRGARVYNSSRSYQCLTGGVSASSGGPTSGTLGLNITDGTVVWLYIGEGTAVGDGTATATVTGPVQAFALDLTTRIGAVAGWQSVMNLLDAVPGQNIATDEQLRELRIAELAGDGKSTQNAIRADLLGLTGVTAATVFVNNTDVTNVDGMPPHSVECMVQGGDDDAIRAALFGAVAAGIATHGTTTGTVLDSQGVSHEVDFSRPTEIRIYVVIHLIYDPATYPSTGDALVQDAVAVFGQSQPSGKDAVSSQLGAQAFTVAGVDDVTACFIGTAPSPSTSTTIAISLRQLATYQSTDVTVVSTPGTP